MPPAEHHIGALEFISACAMQTAGEDKGRSHIFEVILYHHRTHSQHNRKMTKTSGVSIDIHAFWCCANAPERLGVSSSCVLDRYNFKASDRQRSILWLRWTCLGGVVGWLHQNWTQPSTNDYKKSKILTTFRTVADASSAVLRVEGRYWSPDQNFSSH